MPYAVLRTDQVRNADEGRSRPFLLDQFLRSLRVVDDGFDLAAMAHDTIVFQRTINVAPGQARNPAEIEVVKCRAEIVALGKDSAPAR